MICLAQETPGSLTIRPRASNKFCYNLSSLLRKLEIVPPEVAEPFKGYRLFSADP